MENIQNVFLDIMNTCLYEPIYSKQYDSGRKVHFYINDNGNRIENSDIQVYFQMKISENKYVQAICTKEEDYFVLSMNNSLTMNCGLFNFQLELRSQDNKIIRTITGNLIIKESIIKPDDIITEKYPDVVVLLDSNGKVPNNQLYEATLDQYGITKLTDDINSNSTDTAVTPNSVKMLNDKKADLHHKHGDDEIINLDASKISSGTISIDRLPQGALERLFPVENDEERFNLTNNEVQNGDTVKVNSTKMMYRVVDDTQLSTEDGYTEYTAGLAASVPWSGVTDKPNYASSESIGGSAIFAEKLTQSDGSANRPVYFNNGVPVALDYTIEKSVPNNAVFTDTTYSTFIKSGSNSSEGLVPEPPKEEGNTKYLREDGTWSVPEGNDASKIVYNESNVKDELDRLNYCLSHVGMIIHSTTLDTMEKVIAIYGGTKWDKIEGRFLLGSNDDYPIGTTGGESTHVLTTNEMPSHKHTFTGTKTTSSENGSHTHNVNISKGAGGRDDWGLIASGSFGGGVLLKQNETSNYSTVNNAGTHTHTITPSGTINNTGGGKAHNNMPPYKTVYIWERTE